MSEQPTESADEQPIKTNMDAAPGLPTAIVDPRTATLYPKPLLKPGPFSNTRFASLHDDEVLDQQPKYTNAAPVALSPADGAPTTTVNASTATLTPKPLLVGPRNKRPIPSEQPADDRLEQPKKTNAESVAPTTTVVPRIATTLPKRLFVARPFREMLWLVVHSVELADEQPKKIDTPPRLPLPTSSPTTTVEPEMATLTPKLEIHDEGLDSVTLPEQRRKHPKNTKALAAFGAPTTNVGPDTATDMPK